MQVSPIEVTQLPHRIEPDPSRVIPRFFGADEAKTRRTIERVMSLSAEQVTTILRDLERDFSAQHSDITAVWREHFERVKDSVPQVATLNEECRLLIGTYFTMEYAIEAAALFNPSIVPAPEQDGLPPGSTRFLMSLRATGEGHISSIVFRRGVIDGGNVPRSQSSHPKVFRRRRGQDTADY